MHSKAGQPTLIKIITIGAFFAFFLFGFVDNLKGPILPTLLDESGFSYSLGGTILLGSYLGFLIATLTIGPLADIAGKRAAILVACVCLFVGIMGFSLSSTFWALTLTMTVIGLGMGALEVGGNLIIVDLHSRDKGRYLNLLAFFHSIGSMAVPLYAGLLLSAGTSWRSVYQSALLIVVLLFVYFLLVKYPNLGSADKNRLDVGKLGSAVFTGEMILFYSGIAVYVASEIGVAAWLVEFLQQTTSQTLVTSTLYLSLFFGAVTAGRFVGSFLVERFGYRKSLLWASLGSVACSAIGIFGPPALVFFLPLTGLFYSIIFPTSTAAVSDLHKENVGTILGLLFTFAGVGGMLGPWTIGIVSDQVGIEAGFGLIVIFGIGMSIVFGLLARNR